MGCGAFVDNEGNGFEWGVYAARKYTRVSRFWAYSLLLHTFVGVGFRWQIAGVTGAGRMCPQSGFQFFCVILWGMCPMIGRFTPSIFSRFDERMRV